MLLTGPEETGETITRRGAFFHAAFWLPRLSLPLTSSIHWREHYWGDPGDLAVGNRKILLDLLVVDGEGLGECIGESDGNEGAEDDGPAPASIWWGVAKVGSRFWGHVVFPWLDVGERVREGEKKKSFRQVNTFEANTMTTKWILKAYMARAWLRSVPGSVLQSLWTPLL